MINRKPISLSGQPTSHVKIGASKIGRSTEVVRLKHKNRNVYSYVKPVDDHLVDEIGNAVRMHENVKGLFGGFDRSQDFIIDPDVDPAEIPDCKFVSLYTQMDHDELSSFLRDSTYLLRPIEEVVNRGDEMVSFEPVEIEPDGYTTVRITDDTEIEFVDAGEYREKRAVSGGPSTGVGQPGRQSQSGETDEEVQVTLDPKNPSVSFEADVAGLEAVKETASMLLSLFDPDVREEIVGRYGDRFASRGNSMLLYGPPGCGKTLVSEAIAYEAKYNSNIEETYGEVKFLEVKGSDVLSKYSGEAEKRVEAIFEKAHGIAQEGFAVLFFDEVDTLIPDRGDDSLQRHERSLTNAFLQEMNEIEDNLLVIGATNMPFTIDPAATRRFPTQQFIPQPDATVMAEVWRKHLSSIQSLDRMDFERLGEASSGYTPAEIGDRVLGSDFQRELVMSVQEGDPIEPDTAYFLERLAETEPKTVSQYVASVRTQVDDLVGYPEMKRYVEAQAERLGIALHDGGSFEQLLGAAAADAREDADGDDGVDSEEVADG